MLRIGMGRRLCIMPYYMAHGIQWLGYLSNQAKPDVKDQAGWTPIYYAEDLVAQGKKNSNRVVESLVASGVKPTGIDKGVLDFVECPSSSSTSR